MAESDNMSSLTLDDILGLPRLTEDQWREVNAYFAAPMREPYGLGRAGKAETLTTGEFRVPPFCPDPTHRAAGHVDLDGFVLHRQLNLPDVLEFRPCRHRWVSPHVHEFRDVAAAVGIEIPRMTAPTPEQAPAPRRRAGVFDRAPAAESARLRCIQCGVFLDSAPQRPCPVCNPGGIKTGQP